MGTLVPSLALMTSTRHRMWCCLAVAQVQARANLGVMETTNGVYNTDLFDVIIPQSVPYWVRVTVANRMADSGKQWTDIFYRNQSGESLITSLATDWRKEPTITSGLSLISRSLLQASLNQRSFNMPSHSLSPTTGFVVGLRAAPRLLCSCRSNASTCSELLAILQCSILPRYLQQVWVSCHCEKPRARAELPARPPC